MARYDLSDKDQAAELHFALAKLMIKKPVVELKEVGKQRTAQQNKAGHLWFQHIADTFNDQGLDMQATLAKRVGLRWTPEAVKECLFKVLARAMFNKDSTTKLTTNEFSKVAEMLSDVIARDYGLTIEYPSQESLERG